MILVTGATGSVGSKVVDLLLEQQAEVRILTRGQSDWAESRLPQFRRLGVDVMVGDMRSRKTADKAVAGCKAIINCAGVMRSTPEADIESVIIDGAVNLTEAGKEAGVQRFIQLSCLGSTEHATSLYFACQWDAEEIVKESGFHWTIFRPSLIFDPHSFLMQVLDFWVAKAPVIVIVGSGLNRFNPIAAEDVAKCIVQSIYDRDSSGKTYELVGPDTWDLQSMLDKMCETLGKPMRSIRIPSFLGIPLAGLIGQLAPKSPIDSHVMRVMTSEMIAESAPMLEKFQIKRISMKSCYKSLGQIGKDEDEDE
jgi:uncharacterized protein YbjT (DUF2867 family)